MSKLPLYKQIVHDLKAKITSQELAPNEQVPTELEISKQYGVSRITSKRALTELENEKLIYRIQGKGSFVRAQKSETEACQSNDLLFILPFPNNPGLGNYAQGMMNYLQQKEYQLRIQPDTILQQAPIETLLDQYAGFILYPQSSSSNLDLLYTLYLKNYPIVILDKQLEGIPFATVTADNFQGGYDATKHLISLRHKKIAFIATKKVDHSSSVRERYLGYLKALHDAQISFHSQNMFPEEWNEQHEDDFFQEAITTLRAQEITAIVAENDITAIHLMNVIRKQGFRVPEDFVIIGFDNIQAASLIDPALSTISQNFEEMGYLAAKQLVAIIEEKKQINQNITVPVQLIIRGSTI